MYTAAAQDSMSDYVLGKVDAILKNRPGLKMLSEELWAIKDPNERLAAAKRLATREQDPAQKSVYALLEAQVAFQNYPTVETARTFGYRITSAYQSGGISKKQMDGLIVYPGLTNDPKLHQQATLAAWSAVDGDATDDEILRAKRYADYRQATCNVNPDSVEDRLTLDLAHVKLAKLKALKSIKVAENSEQTLLANLELSVVELAENPYSPQAGSKVVRNAIALHQGGLMDDDSLAANLGEMDNRFGAQDPLIADANAYYLKNLKKTQDALKKGSAKVDTLKN